MDINLLSFSTVASAVKMPLGLFTNKFSPKKGAPRKTHSLTNLNRPHDDAELGIDYGPIKLKLGSNEIVFDGGEWISGNLSYFYIYFRYTG